MIESIKHADEQIEHFKKLGLPAEVLSIIRLELITAFRDGYECACKYDFDMKKLEY